MRPLIGNSFGAALSVLACAGLLALGGCMGRGGKGSAQGASTSTETFQPPKRYGYRVVNAYPHSTDSYTQGLLWHDGFLYESTGLNGHSALLKVDLLTGRAVERRELAQDYFGEGLALHGERLYQLTWQQGACLTYTLDNFAPAGHFTYKGEGWGLTSNGEHLWMSDGTDVLREVDPATFRTLRTVQVTAGRETVPYLNELEWIDGEVWANVYTTWQIVRIDPASGRVVGIIDLTGLLPAAEFTADTDVLNGIAWDGSRLFVTGKNWPKLFEIELVEK